MNLVSITAAASIAGVGAWEIRQAYVTGQISLYRTPSTDGYMGLWYDGDEVAAWAASF